MSADTGHDFWLGKLNMPLALAKENSQVTGSVTKIMSLRPAMRPAFPKYKFLGANGLGELVG